MISCARHNRYEADYHCPRCQAGFCRSCVQSRQFGNVKVSVCPTCGEKLTDLNPLRPAIPFWYRVPEFLFFPLKGDGWMMMVGWALFATVAKTMTIMPSWVALIFYIVYNGLLVSYFYRVIAKAEDGNMDVPEWNEYQGFWETFFWPFLRYWAANVFVFWPAAALVVAPVLATWSFTNGLAVVGHPAGAGLFLLLCLMGLFFLPMSLLVMGVFKNFVYHANPYFLGQQIGRIWKEYLLAVAMIISLLIFYMMFYVLIHAWLGTLGLVKYLIVFPINGVLELYLYMVVGHLLGYLAWQTRFKLKWWPETQQDPVFMVAGKSQPLEWDPELRVVGAGGGIMAAAGAAVTAAGAAVVATVAAARPSAPAPAGSAPPAAGPARPRSPRPAGGPDASTAPGPALDSEAQEQLTRDINDGMSLIQHGRHEEAAALYDRILAASPNHLGALRGRMLAATGLHDQEGASKFGASLGAELARQEAWEPLWDFYQETRQTDKNFLLRARDQIAFARWLVAENKALEAARVLREIGVGRPEDPLAPKALYQCAELLWKNCDKPEVAKQMFEYILKRYPQSAFADQVRAALAALAK
jgi:hypothetical protein